jgi:GxxExxY protein
VADARLRDRRPRGAIEKRFTAKVAKDARRTRWMTIEEVGHAVIGAALKIDSIVGPGLLESAYETCLIYELEKQRLRVRGQVMVPIRYEELIVDNGYRIDVLVEDAVVVELKAVTAILPCTAGNSSAICVLVGSSWVSC